MEIDVSAWTVIRDEPGGRDKNKRGSQRMPTRRVINTGCGSTARRRDGSEAALTDCAEVFTSRLASAIDLPAAECRFAVLDSELGLISHNVTPHGFNLNTGTTYLPEVEGYQRRPSAGSDADGGRMRLDEGYTLDSMEQVLEHVEAPPGVGDLSGFAVFAGYLVLDALVGNGDRHPGNWAILERQSVRATAHASSRRPTTMAARWAPA